MTTLCSVEGCDRLAISKGKCSLHYQREYMARKKAERLSSPSATEIESPVIREQPGITAEEIDSMPDNQLNDLVMQEIYGEIYGCVPAKHPQAMAFREANPGIRVESGTTWFWPDKKPGYDF